MVPVTTVSPPPSSAALSSSSPAPHAPAEGRERARRTDAIVADLRDAIDGTPGRQALTDRLIEANAGVARSMASRYRNRGVDLEDLEQVALLGLLKAARRFDPTAGHDFMSYAVPTIRGELRKHFRDHGWMVRPPRRVQDLQARIGVANRELERELGRSARPSEVATHLGEDLSDVVEALTADGCFTPTSLDGVVGGGDATLGDLIGHEDRALETVEARVVLAPAVRQLSDRDRRIVEMRFFHERTQQEIAEDVGLTQAQVSRVIARILTTLRGQLVEARSAA